MLKLQYSILAAAVLLGVLPIPATRVPGTGYYQAARRGDKAWLIAPDGKPALLLGLDHVHLISASAPRTDLAPAYVDQRAAAILAGMRADGFNTLGGGADGDLWHRGLPYIQTLDISSHLQADQQIPVVDVYAAGFAAEVRSLAQVACSVRVRDPDLIGYFSDDGLDWDPAMHPEVALTYYLQLPLSAPGRQQAMDFLRDRYGSNIGQVTRAWAVKARDFVDLQPPARATAGFDADAAAFGYQILDRYLQTVADAIRAVDPNHLYLGAVLGFDPAEPYAPDTPAALAWSIADAASAAIAPGPNAAAELAALGRLTSKPLLVEVPGCHALPPDMPAALAAAPLLGYVWAPDSDWQSGACAAEAQADWVGMNRQMTVVRHAGQP